MTTWRLSAAASTRHVRATLTDGGIGPTLLTMMTAEQLIIVCKQQMAANDYRDFPGCKVLQVDDITLDAAACRE